MLDSILRLCLKPDIAPIPEAAMAPFMTAVWQKDRAAFEKYPDGQFPRKTDAELKAIYDKMDRSWFASR